MIDNQALFDTLIRNNIGEITVTTATRLADELGLTFNVADFDD